MPSFLTCPAKAVHERCPPFILSQIRRGPLLPDYSNIPTPEVCASGSELELALCGVCKASGPALNIRVIHKVLGANEPYSALLLSAIFVCSHSFWRFLMPIRSPRGIPPVSPIPTRAAITRDWCDFLPPVRCCGSWIRDRSLQRTVNQQT